MAKNTLFNDYDAFTARFEQTTIDDCYTPDAVYDTVVEGMRASIRIITLSIGILMLLFTAVIGDSSPALVLAWVVISVALVAFGRGFSFQQK